MGRKKSRIETSDVGDELGQAEVLGEAADKKLEAAQKLARANAMLRAQRQEEDPAEDGEGEEGEEAQVDLDPRMFPSPEPQPHPTPAESKLEQILKGLNGDGKFEVYKRVGGSRMKCGVFPLSDWPDIMDSIAREHGGGDFQVLFKDPKGNYAGSDTQTYDPKTYGKPERQNGDSAFMAQMLQMMQAREERYLTQIEQLRADQTRMMLEFLKSRDDKPKERTVEEVVALMKASKDLSGEKDSPLESVKGILEVVAMLNNHGVGEPPSPINLAIDKAFQVLGPLLGAWVAKQAGNGAGSTPVPVQPPRPALPAPRTQGGPAAPLPAPPPAPAPAPVDPRLATYAKSLLNALQAGQEPSNVADAILSMVPDEGLDDLKAMVDDPGFVGMMIQTEAALVPHQAWLVSLCNEIRSRIVEEPEPAPEPSSGQPQAEPPVTPAPAPSVEATG